MGTGWREGMRLWLGPLAGVAAIIVLVVVYFLVATPHVAPKAASVLGVTVNEMSSLTFRSKGQTLTLYQVTNKGGVGTTWTIGSTTGTPADQSLTQSFASSLATLQPSRTLTKSATSAQLKAYGLNPATSSVTIGLTGGKSAVTLNVGITSPIGGYYAQIAGKPAVFMLSGNVPTEISASTAAWLPPASGTSSSGSGAGAPGSATGSSASAG